MTEEESPQTSDEDARDSGAPSEPPAGSQMEETSAEASTEEGDAGSPGEDTASRHEESEAEGETSSEKGAVGSSANDTTFAPESWGQAARGIALVMLIAAALAVLLQLSFGGDWVIDFIDDNRLKMDERMMLIYQLVGAGLASGFAALVAVLYGKNNAATAESLERWGWFLSPLILSPAIAVTMRHEVWARKHEDLLPVILFGALIAEVFFSKAAANVPPLIQRAWDSFWDEEDESKDEDSKSVRVRNWLEKHQILLLVVVGALAYGAFMSFYTVRWHHKLGTATFDLGINNNLLYGGLEGRFNQSPVIFPDEPQNYLANHVKIGLYTLLPIYALFPKAETLLIIQSVSLGLGAIPLFLFARKRIPEGWAAALAFCYLAYYPMHGANFYEMKVVPTTAALVLTCIWALDAKRFWLGGITFVWALIMREDMPIPLAVVGVVLLLSGHRPKAGALMAAVASVWFIYLRFNLMPKVDSWWFPNMYEDLWSSPEKGFKSVIKTLISNPTFSLEHIFVEKKFWYMMHLLVPMAFIPVRRWWGWAAMVPGVILTLIVTDYAPPTMFSFQYVMHWSPYLFIAASLVLASQIKQEGGKPRALGALAAMCLASAALSFNYGAFPLRDKALESGYHKIEFSFSEEERQRLADVRKVVAHIPQDASVGSTERIGAHLSSRVGFYTLRRGSHGVEYMVARKKGLRLDRTKQTIRKGLESGEYGVDARFGDFIIFKRGANTDKNEDVIKEWRLRSPKKAKKSSRGKAKRKSKKSAASKKSKTTKPKDDAKKTQEAPPPGGRPEDTAGDKKPSNK